MIQISSFAFFKPKANQPLTPKVKWMKTQAQHILREINKSQIPVGFSILQLSELNNIFKSRMNWEKLQNFLMDLVSNPLITIFPVHESLYTKAIDRISEMNMDANDITAYLLMKDRNMEKIFSLDKHFQNLPDITCIPKIPKKFQ